MSESQTQQKPNFELLDDGSVIQNHKGRQIVLAKFDTNDGFCEFENLMFDKKFREQVTRAITENTSGDKSNNVITEYGIKNRPRDKKKENEPECPKPTRLLGDKTPGIVSWYFRWRPQAAYVRYGVELDKAGEPIVVHGRRDELRYEEDPKTGGVKEMLASTEKTDGFLARRATHLTFLQSEVVGGSKDAPSIEVDGEYAP